MKRLIFSILFIFALVFNGVFAQALNIKLPLLKVVEEWSIISNTFIDIEISSQKPYMVTHLRILPLDTDHPVIHPMLDFYQQDRRFSNLFSTDGRSMLCGPTSLANVLVYLKYNHSPKYEKIFEDHEDELKLNADWVPFLYRFCKTDRNRGTSMSNLRDCAKEAIAEGGYNTDNIFIRGSRSSIESQKFAVGPGDLRAFSVFSPDRGVVLHFGWYRKVEKNGAEIYERKGGHYIALAGHDAVNPNVFYVSDPLVDYSQIYPIRYSKITLKRLPGGVQAPANMEWYTEDLVSGHFAIMEDILVVLPLE